MVLLYSDKISNRLHYVSNFIFKELMQADVSITSNPDDFNNYEGIKVNYSSGDRDGFKIRPVQLLFEPEIKEQSIQCFETNGHKAFFKTESPDFPFDILAAAFYLVSRYEEYLPYEKDAYERYPHEQSLAFKEGFLQVPLVNIWLADFIKALQSKYPAFTPHLHPYKFTPTYDIDIAFAYAHKGIVRNMAGGIKSIVTADMPSFKERSSVLIGRKKDPFEEYYDRLDSLHRQYDLHPFYFFLVAERNNRYDKNILPDKQSMQTLIRRHAKKYTIGLHPSWRSGRNLNTLEKEKDLLENISKRSIFHSRQHYIKLELPSTYRRLIEIGILNDYSMGYGSINGFRASVASSFHWFDLKKEEPTGLRIHPFCYMEANSYYEEHLSTEATFDELMHYYKVCREVNGTFITIWHNHILANDKFFYGWGRLYEQFLEKICGT